MKEIVTLSQMTQAELEKELATATHDLEATSFSLRQGKEKRTHLLRQLRTRIARIKTLLRSRSTSPTS